MESMGPHILVSSSGSSRTTSTLVYSAAAGFITKASLIKKYDHYRRQWSTMRAVLSSYELRLYLDLADSLPNCVLPLHDFVIYAIDEQSVGVRYAFHVVTAGESWLLAAESAHDQMEWMEAINKCPKPSKSSIPSTVLMMAASSPHQPQTLSTPTSLSKSQSYYGPAVSRRSSTPSHPSSNARSLSPRRHSSYVYYPTTVISSPVSVVHHQTPVKIANVSARNIDVGQSSRNANTSTVSSQPSLSFEQEASTNSQKADETLESTNQSREFTGKEFCKPSTAEASVGTDDANEDDVCWDDLEEVVSLLESQFLDYQVSRDRTIGYLQSNKQAIQDNATLLAQQIAQEKSKQKTLLESINHLTSDHETQRYQLQSENELLSHQLQRLCTEIEQLKHANENLSQQLQNLQKQELSTDSIQSHPLVDQSDNAIYAEILTLTNRMQIAMQDVSAMKMALTESTGMMSPHQSESSYGAHPELSNEFTSSHQVVVDKEIEQESEAVKPLDSSQLSQSSVNSVDLVKPKRRPSDFQVTVASKSQSDTHIKECMRLLRLYDAKQLKPEELSAQMKTMLKTTESIFASLRDEIRATEQNLSSSQHSLQKKSTELQRLQERFTKLDSEHRELIQSCKLLKEEKRKLEVERLELVAFVRGGKLDTQELRNLNDSFGRKPSRKSAPATQGSDQ